MSPRDRYPVSACTGFVASARGHPTLKQGIAEMCLRSWRSLVPSDLSFIEDSDILYRPRQDTRQPNSNDFRYDPAALPTSLALLDRSLRAQRVVLFPKSYYKCELTRSIHYRSILGRMAVHFNRRHVYSALRGS